MDTGRGFGKGATAVAPIRLARAAALALALSAASAAPAPAAGGGEFVIAARGAPPQASIRCANPGSEVEKYAAEELRRCVLAMTGVELPIADGGMVPPGKAILLSSEEFADDGFELSVEGDTLKVRGGRRAGVLHGVYELLETYGGCGWFAPNAEVLPEGDSFAVPASLRDRQVPDFEMRNISVFDPRFNPDFSARIRLNGERACERSEARHGGPTDFRYCRELPNCHTFMYLMPPKKYFRSHPEYFAEIDGIRREFGAAESQPCLSNPDAVKIMTDKVIEIVRRHPENRYFGVSQNDNSNYCRCERCRAVDEEEGSPSGSIARFVNHVAEEVGKIRPDAVVETLAYSYSVKPPLKTRMRPNVLVCVCSMGMDCLVPIPESRHERNLQFVENIRGWGEKTSNLFVWDYGVNFRHYTHPFPNVGALAGNPLFFKRNGVTQILEQLDAQGPHSDFAELKTWLLAKLMWKADQPVDPLLDRFFRAYYGEGAQYARAWFDELHARASERYVKDGRSLWIYERICDQVIPDEVYDRGAELWRRACEATKGSPAHHEAARWGRFGLEVTRATRGFRGPRCADYVCTLHPERVDAARREELREVARSFIVPMLDAAPPVWLCEQPQMNKRIIREMREFAMGRSPSVVSNVIVMEHWRINPSATPADKRRVADPKAALGRAVAYPHRGWNLTPADWVGTDPDGKYRLRAHVRVELEPGADDKGLEAFRLVVKRDRCKEPVVSHSVKLGEVGDGYAWYDFGGEFTPAAGDQFDILPGELADRIHPSCKVFVDRVEWTALE